MLASENGGARSLCAHVARQCCEDPIGSVFLPDCAVLLELPLPWSEQIWRSPHVSAALRRAISRVESGGARCYALAPDAQYSQPGMRRVMVLRRPAGLFARFERQEYLLPDGLVPGLLTALAEQQGQPAGYDSYVAAAGAARDLLICTHGSLDACCGRLGYPLYQLLRQQHAGADQRVWRVSHFGGHRFAPTMLEFPYGLGWAYLEPETLDSLLYRRGPVHEALPYFRGWGGLHSYYLQLAERAVLLQEGWDWLDYRRAGMVLRGRADGYPICEDEPEAGAAVRISYSSPDGRRSGCYEATIERFGRMVTALSCSGSGLQSIHQYRVSDLQHFEQDAQAPLLAQTALAAGAS